MENPSSAYLSPEGFVDRLISEVDAVIDVRDRLVFSASPARPAGWAQNIWQEPAVLDIKSISDGARQLKSMHSAWVLFPLALHRRSALIEEKLHKVSIAPQIFPGSPPKSPLGSWTLLDANTLIASPKCSSPFPNGEIFFKEDRKGPPSRAYLKLWETWTMMAKWPKGGEFCIDSGGSPGGWCWAIQQTGARVLSVDRSPLDNKIASLPGVEFKKGSAFSLRPEDFDSVDWLFSDVICYPEKLYEWVVPWVESGACRNMVCTIKFQGEYDAEIVNRFADISGGRVHHLFNNKNELTWIWTRGE